MPVLVPGFQWPGGKRQILMAKSDNGSQNSGLTKLFHWCLTLVVEDAASSSKYVRSGRIFEIEVRFGWFWDSFRNTRGHLPRHARCVCKRLTRLSTYKEHTLSVPFVKRCTKRASCHNMATPGEWPCHAGAQQRVRRRNTTRRSFEWPVPVTVRRALGTGPHCVPRHAPLAPYAARPCYRYCSLTWTWSVAVSTSSSSFGAGRTQNGKRLRRPPVKIKGKLQQKCASEQEWVRAHARKHNTHTHTHTQHIHYTHTAISPSLSARDQTWSQNYTFAIRVFAFSDSARGKTRAHKHN